MSFTNWSKSNLPRKNLNDGSSDWWTVSGSGTSEYYYNQTDIKYKPLAVFENGTELSEGTVGSLNASQWAWGDNDSIGHNTIYIRLSDGADPDSKSSGYVKSSSEIEVLQADTDKKIVIVSYEIFNNDKDDDSSFRILRTESDDTVFYKDEFTVPADDGIKIDTKICLKSGQKIKVMSVVEDVSIVFNGDDNAP
ncbi:MAG: hypothetical protein ACP6IQ_02385 [Candidatus Njordarchaeia archaeon]